MDHAAVQSWLDRYVEAWQRNEAGPIEALFAEDATYRFAPFGEENVATGRKEIANAWLRNPDPPGTWEAQYEPYAVDGNRAVATGTSHYLPSHPRGDRVYFNVYLLEFAPDRTCSSFTELYMREQGPD